MGGTVTVDSTEGVGTTFTVSLALQAELIEGKSDGPRIANMSLSNSLSLDKSFHNSEKDGGAKSPQQVSENSVMNIQKFKKEVSITDLDGN